MSNKVREMPATTKRIPTTLLLEMALEREKLGTRITQRRNELRMTQEEVIDKIGISPRQYQRWESGHAMPRWDALDTLADALETSVDWLLDDKSPIVTKRDEQLLASRLETLERKMDLILRLLEEKGDLDPPSGLLPELKAGSPRTSDPSQLQNL